MIQTDRPSPTSPLELIDLLQCLSQAATGHSWAVGTSNAAWLLTRYGGRWSRADASTHAELLDTIDASSLALGLWPTIGPAKMTADGLLSHDMAFASRREFRDRWALLEGDGVVLIASELHLRANGLRAPIQVTCGRELATSAQTAPARLRSFSWCATCGDAMAAEIANTLDWSPNSERR